MELLSDRLFFFCPSCGSAWENPSPSEPRELRSHEALAPTGMTLPTREQVEASTFRNLVVQTVPYEEWAYALEDYLQE
jgi:hypothetical protein